MIMSVVNWSGIIYGRIWAEMGYWGKRESIICKIFDRDCYDKNKFPFKFGKMLQIFDGHNKMENFSNLDPTFPEQKL
jgi:hypothetical protein